MDKIKKLSFKRLVIAFFTVVALVVVMCYLSVNRRPVEIEISGTYIKTPIKIGQFNLIDQDGNPLTKKQLQDHWTFVFFGFTSCPVYCPTTLTVLNTMYKQLEKQLPKDQLPKVVMVSVDPETDTRVQLKRVIHQFNPNFVGARGSKQEIIALEKQLHLAVSEDNLMNHSMVIVLINPQVEVQAYFSYPQNPAQLSVDFQRILKNA